MLYYIVVFLLLDFISILFRLWIQARICLFYLQYFIFLNDILCFLMFFKLIFQHLFLNIFLSSLLTLFSFSHSDKVTCLHFMKCMLCHYVAQLLYENNVVLRNISKNVYESCLYLSFVLNMFIYSDESINLRRIVKQTCFNNQFP